MRAEPLQNNSQCIIDQSAVYLYAGPWQTLSAEARHSNSLKHSCRGKWGQFEESPCFILDEPGTQPLYRDIGVCLKIDK